MKIVEAMLTGNSNHAHPWKNKMRCVIGDEPVSFETAQAHLAVAQADGYVIREGYRGPKGGRGKLRVHRGDKPWPGWHPNKGIRYFIAHLAPPPDKVVLRGDMYDTGSKP